MEKKKPSKILWIILIIGILITLLFLTIFFIKNKQDKAETITGIVVKVNENSIDVMDKDNQIGLFSVGRTEAEGTNFKKGQEIIIYFDGIILSTYPAQLGNIDKIEIRKEESEISIPEDIIRYCYSSRNKVKVDMTELTKNGIAFNITDTNELPYTYSNDYTLYKKEKDEEYTGVGETIGENTDNSTSGYTRNRIGIYLERSNKNLRNRK